MRQQWFDNVPKMIAKVNSSARTRWSNEDLQHLFHVREESARKLLLALGRGKTTGSNYGVEPAQLKTFLEEFLAIFLPAGKDKGLQAKAVRDARILLEKKVQAGREAISAKASKPKPRPESLPASNPRIGHKLAMLLAEALRKSSRSRQAILEEALDEWLQKQNRITSCLRARSKKIPLDADPVQGKLPFDENAFGD